MIDSDLVAIWQWLHRSHRRLPHLVEDIRQCIGGRCQEVVAAYDSSKQHELGHLQAIGGDQRRRAEGGMMTDLKWEWTGQSVSREELKQQVGPGWGTIVDTLITDLLALGWNGRVEQVKEKFGGLRFYIAAIDDAMQDRIDRASRESLATCDQCGAVGSLDRTNGGWLVTRCDAHMDPIQSEDDDEEA